MKNSNAASGGLSGTQTVVNLVKAVNSPESASAPEEVVHGATIKAIWLVIDVCGLGGTGVLNFFEGYVMKNPGANLTPPSPSSVGTSNEKKFVFKEYFGMIMRNQDGNAALHWEGWIPIPKRYQRFGTDDTLVCVLKCTTALTGHWGLKFIYKWFS